MYYDNNMYVKRHLVGWAFFKSGVHNLGHGFLN